MAERRNWNVEKPIVGEEIGLAHSGHNTTTHYRATISRVAPSGKQFTVEYKVRGETQRQQLYISKYNGDADQGRYSNRWYACSLEQVEAAVFAKLNKQANLRLSKRFGELLGPIQLVADAYARGQDPTADQLIAASSAAKLIAGACTTLSRNEPGVKESV